MNRSLWKENKACVYFLLYLGLFILFSVSTVKSQFNYYIPIWFNQATLGGIPIYSNIPISSAQDIPSSNFSYEDYYKAYPYLDLQNSTQNSSFPGSGTIYSNNASTYSNNSANNSGTYQANTTLYIPRYSPYVISPIINNTYQIAQPTTYTSLSSNTYQTVSSYSEAIPVTNNTNVQNQSQQSSIGYYNYVSSSPTSYFPAQNYYPSNANYFPSNTISSTQAPYSGYYVPSSGYYVPNANYWPSAEIEVADEEPVDIDGEYKGEWESETTGEDGEICASIDQIDTQISGSIKLKGFVIEVKGKPTLTGTVNGTTVTFEVYLDGPTLEFEGVVQADGDIVGTYVVEGSSSVLDEGTITLIPK